MKKKLLSVLIILAVGVFILLGSLLLKKPVPIGTVESFTFSYTCGTYLDARRQYALSQTESGYRATVLVEGVPAENAQTIPVEEEFVRRLEDLLRRHKIGRWNGFARYSKQVMDGDSFSLFILMETGEIDASGYEIWPKNYKEFKAELEALFSQLR